MYDKEVRTWLISYTGDGWMLKVRNCRLGSAWTKSFEERVDSILESTAATRRKVLEL